MTDLYLNDFNDIIEDVNHDNVAPIDPDEIVKVYMDDFNRPVVKVKDGGEYIKAPAGVIYQKNGSTIVCVDRKALVAGAVTFQQ